MCASPEQNLYVIADINAEKFASILRCGTTSFLGPRNCFRSGALRLLPLLIQCELLSLKGTTEESKLITIVCGQTWGENKRAEFYAEGHGEVPVATLTCHVR